MLNMLSACVPFAVSPTPNNMQATAQHLYQTCPVNDTAPKHYLALGDSYTIGEGVEPNQRWSYQLSGWLFELGWQIQEPTVIARTGWTTGELAEQLARTRLAGPFDLVSLLIGVNNQYRGYSEEEYRIEFTQLLQQAIGYAGGNAAQVFVLSIPDWGVTPFGLQSGKTDISAQIDRFNQINLTVSEEYGVGYVDITSISREKTDPSQYVAQDGLHPSGAMYAEWAKLALPIACKALHK